MSKVFDFKVGQEVIMFVKGAGTVSEERYTVEEVNNDGVVKVDDCDKEFGLDGKWLGIDTFFGFDFWIKPVTE
ncbi:hypothetical protein P9266_18940 [Bacillus subtilis]|uniref:hypothetical protein n=1 Tax=Bacillus subtilis group TaxID=653685 RepID=UPI0022823D93|nr:MULTISPECIES: hypothetical protein [Bacillus subtilis group]MCY8997934.1 hypothetical protein [Bacillus inaquosorum]MEC2296775.1 hypothetical protein [Bacillus subtilis]MED1967158.1 hypothetical protein [Bacillus subtilis]MED4541516.1 hypothetical protein [Bacillus subtilis]MED4598426.1 hypothetical protein [Bacillus subtilis]